MTVRRRGYEPKLFEVGQRLVSLRKTKQLNQEKFAEATGISVRQIRNIETGASMLTLETLIKMHLSKVFDDKSLSELFEALIVPVYDPTDDYE
jgi:transcriptional regulator with XRE-family HTH domain